MSLRFLASAQYNRGEWDFVCGAHSIKTNLQQYFFPETMSCLEEEDTLY